MRWITALLLGACSKPAPAPAPTTPPAVAAIDAPADPTFVLAVSATTTGATGESSLVDQKLVHAKDRVVFSIRTTHRTTLHVAYCDTAQHLAIYPPTGELVAEPDALVRVPRTDAFIADDHVGLEHFFVIASATSLAATDPKLDELLRSAEKDGAPCTATLAMTTDESRAQAKLAPVKPVRGAHPAPAPRTAEIEFSKIPAVWRPRGFGLGETAGTSSMSSDAAGIASWAITIDHQH